MKMLTDAEIDKLRVPDADGVIARLIFTVDALKESKSICEDYRLRGLARIQSLEGERDGLAHRLASKDREDYQRLVGAMRSRGMTVSEAAPAEREALAAALGGLSARLGYEIAALEGTRGGTSSISRALLEIANEIDALFAGTDRRSAPPAPADEGRA